LSWRDALERRLREYRVNLFVDERPRCGKGFGFEQLHAGKECVECHFDGLAVVGPDDAIVLNVQIDLDVFVLDGSLS